MDYKALAVKTLPYLAVLVIGAGIGWALKPYQVRVEEKTKVVEVEKQVVVTHETVRVEVVRVKDTQVVDRWHREKTEETRPDGTVVTKEVEDRNIDTVVHDKENTNEVKVVEVVKEVVVEKEVLVYKLSEPVLAQWHLGVLVGTAPRFDSIGETPILLGVEADHRFVGPVFLGAWVMAGSPVTGGFKVANAALGLKLGLEF